MHPKLNIPDYPLRLREREGRHQVFDILRKKFVSLTPEEWVRQHFIWYLVHEREIPASWCVAESRLFYNGMLRRSDILVHDSRGAPGMVVECKAPHVKLSDAVIRQVIQYNWVLRAKYIVVTNGMRHLACEIDYGKPGYAFLKHIPGRGEL